MKSSYGSKETAGKIYSFTDNYLICKLIKTNCWKIYDDELHVSESDEQTAELVRFKEKSDKRHCEKISRISQYVFVLIRLK